MTELLRSLASGRRPRPRALIVPLLLITLLCIAGFSVGALARTEPRTIVLVARDMTFYLPGDPARNPRLVVERGEALRLVLKNEDPGMAHDLKLPSLGAATAILREAGTSTEMTLRAPREAGEHSYQCSLHAVMMRGVLEVR